MSAKPVNLRRARKVRAREEARTEADANAARHGEAKPVRSLRQAREVLEARRLEGHRRDDVRDDADDRAND
ncbi:MAG: DUF4169 family protein, partial [Proteobacteria bacterium]|nr:DUF4169 family protein [Pseudomonadota bacterium]